MNATGIIIGAVTFLLIGLFHPIVIKAEYYFSKKIWILFLILGLIFIASSFLINNYIGSSIVSIIGISFLWSIKELFEQEERVKKGWYPNNPKRKY